MTPKTQGDISFTVTKEDSSLIGRIVDRAIPAGSAARRDLKMDITALHANGCALRLADLLGADDFNFFHDVYGIQRHIDRNTAQLRHCFIPRFASSAARPPRAQAV